MKKAIIIHGWGGSPEEPMHKWIKNELEKKDYVVTAPNMPNTDEPKINSWVSKLKEVVKEINENTLLIGHSIGTQAILRFLEMLEKNVRVGRVILIAPWLKISEQTLKEEGDDALEIARPWMETPINWEKIKVHCDDFNCIFSTNDPYIPVSAKSFFEKKLGAKVVILKDRGHFSEDTGIVNLPEILEFIK